jgi:hemolysin III
MAPLMSSSVRNPNTTYRDYTQSELVADGVVHAVAIVAGIVGFAVLFRKIAIYGAMADGLAMAVYAAGFFLLFGFSCAYNLAPPSNAKAILRRFDHASIYLMIGGTYTALLSQARASLGLVALAIAVWVAAIAGATLKLLLPGRFDRFAVRLYLALGWSAIFAAKPLVQALPINSLGLVFAGGIFYSVGVAFFLWESLKFQTAIWHAFVAIAAACQFAAVLAAIGR